MFWQPQLNNWTTEILQTATHHNIVENCAFDLLVNSYSAKIVAYQSKVSWRKKRYLLYSESIFLPTNCIISAYVGRTRTLTFEARARSQELTHRRNFYYKVCEKLLNHKIVKIVIGDFVSAFSFYFIKK